MNQGIRTILYPVRDLTRAKKLFSDLLGIKPSTDQAYYVGFTVGDQEMGLVPNGHKQGMTGPIDFYHLDEIRKSLQALLKDGAQALQEIKDVDGGKLTATVNDPDGNVIGLIQMP